MSGIYSVIAIAAAAVPNADTGRLNIFVDDADLVWKAKDDSGTIIDIDREFDATDIPITLTVPSDWDTSPANVNAATDELASRMRIAENEITVLQTAYNRRGAVKDIVDNTQAPPTEVNGDRYILDFTAGVVDPNWDGASAGDIVQFDGSTWNSQTPEEGWVAYVDDQNKDALYTDDGTPAWELRNVAVSDHDDLQNKNANPAFQHITQDEKDNIPLDDEKDALQGTQGSPSDSNRYVTSSDPRLSDERVPVDNSATNAKLADMPANTVKTNPTAASADPQDLTMGPSTILARLTSGNIVAATVAQITALLNLFTTTLKGLVPAPGVGSLERYLRSDGSWQEISGSSKEFSEMYFPNTNGLVTTIPGAGVPVKVAGNTTFGITSPNWSMPLPNRLQWNGPQNIRIKADGGMSIEKNGAGGDENFTGYIAQTGSVLTRSKSTTRGDNADVHPAQPKCFAELAPGQYIEVWIQNNADADNVIVRDLHVDVTELELV